MRHGFDGLSMRKVAEKVGITATAIYRHYRDKDELMQYMIAEGFKTFHSYLEASYIGKDPKEDFHNGVLAYKRFAFRKNKHYRLIFMSNNYVAFHSASSELVEHSENAFNFLVDRSQDCIDAKIFRENDLVQIANQLWSLLHGMVSLYLLGRLNLKRKEFDHFYLETINNFTRGLQ